MANCKLTLNCNNHYNYSDLCCAHKPGWLVYKPHWWRWPGICQPNWSTKEDESLNSAPISPQRAGKDTYNWWASSVQMQLMGQILLRYCAMICPCALSDYVRQEIQSTAVSRRKGNTAESSPRAGDQPATANSRLGQKKVKKRFQSLNRM